MPVEIREIKFSGRPENTHVSKLKANSKNMKLFLLVFAYCKKCPIRFAESITQNVRNRHLIVFLRSNNQFEKKIRTPQFEKLGYTNR